jgi:hypothetical protein
VPASAAPKKGKPADVADMLQRLKLTSQESKAVILEDDDDLGCPQWALVGKVLAPNTLHISTIRSALRPAWGNPQGLEFHPLGANMFMAEFGCEKDKVRILDGSPWNVGRQAVILNEFDLSIKPADIRFEELTIWARILNLPFSLMNDQRGKSLAECVGAVKKMDVDEKGRAWGEYLRFRVTIKVAEPLMRCVSTFSQKGRLLMCMR